MSEHNDTYYVRREALFKRLTDPAGDPPPDYDMDLFRLECLHGIPDEYRSLSWKILLGLLPFYHRRNENWKKVILDKRNTYYKLVKDILPASSFKQEKCESINSALPPRPGKGNNDRPISSKPSRISSGLSENDEQLLVQIHKDIRRTFRGLDFLQGFVKQTFYTPLNGVVKTNEDYIDSIDTRKCFSGMSLSDETISGVKEESKVTKDSTNLEKGKTPGILCPPLPHWHAMERVLFIYAKLNPGVGGGYVQGMNEILAPLYYVFSLDKNEEESVHAEADLFYCFSQIISELRDHYINSMDNVRPTGTRSRTESSTSVVSNNSETYRVFQNDISAGTSHNSSNKEFSSSDLIAAANDASKESNNDFKGKLNFGDMYSYLFNNQTKSTTTPNETADVTKPVRIPSDADFSVIKHGNGIGITMDRLLKRLRKFDRDLFLDLQNKGIHPAYYSFRWLTCLLTYEFQLKDLIRIWDSILSDMSFDIQPDNPYSDLGIQSISPKVKTLKNSLESIDEKEIDKVDVSSEYIGNIYVDSPKSKAKSIVRNNKFNFLLDICCAMLILAKDKLIASNFEECLSFLQNYSIEDPQYVLDKTFEFWIPPVSQQKLEQFDALESEISEGNAVKGLNVPKYYLNATFTGLLDGKPEDSKTLLGFLGFNKQSNHEEKHRLLRAKKLLSSARRMRLSKRIKELGKDHVVITGSALSCNRSSQVSRPSTSSISHNEIDVNTGSINYGQKQPIGDSTSNSELCLDIGDKTADILNDGWRYVFDCKVKVYPKDTPFINIFRRTDLNYGGFQFKPSNQLPLSPLPTLNLSSVTTDESIFPEFTKDSIDSTNKREMRLKVSTVLGYDNPSLIEPDDGCIGSPLSSDFGRQKSADTLLSPKGTGTPVSPSLAILASPIVTNESKNEFNDLEDIVDTRRSVTNTSRFSSTMFAGSNSKPLFEDILWETSMIKQQQRTRKRSLLLQKHDEVKGKVSDNKVDSLSLLSSDSRTSKSEASFKDYFKKKYFNQSDSESTDTNLTLDTTSSLGKDENATSPTSSNSALSFLGGFIKR